MATRLKSVEFWFPLYTTTITDNTDTTLTQITVYLPESGKTFRKATLDCVIGDQNGGAANIDRRQLSLQLGSAGYSAVNNATADQIGNAGENQVITFCADFTSYFTTNWSGTSMTCDCKVLFDTDQAASPVGFINASVRLTIAYDYDDTSATHIKTVWIPLNAPVGELGSTKPGSATDTIPQLTGSGSPYLPENSPTIRQTTIVVQGNGGSNVATDHSFSTEIGSGGAVTTGVYECSLQSDWWMRFNNVATWTTTSSQSWYLWGSIACAGHLQAWVVVTYEFTVSGTTTILHSLMLPFHAAPPAGGTTSSDYQRFVADLWIEDPATITTKQMAAYVYWWQNATVAGIYFRFGTGSFISYADDCNVMAGGIGAMIRNDSAFTLARGKQTLTADVYRTDTTDLMYALCGYFLVNYTSGVPSGGPGAGTRTVVYPLLLHGTGAGGGNLVYSATAPTIAETDFCFVSLGVQVTNLTATSAFPFLCLSYEQTSGEGGVRWIPAIVDPVQTDGEIGISMFYEELLAGFKRWTSDPDTRRLDIETSRRWRHVCFNTAYVQLDLLLTYHNITRTVSGTVSGYVDADGAGLTVEIWRNTTPPEKVAEVTTTTDGAYSATVYDNTLSHFATCREDSTHCGRSDNVTPT